ncbi:hypothetical protein AVEN_14139-1 [Araneus ventricosus]|uniref:Uncharacterized protein n=1 Tax=Araneus ventricosus TaxID=182803 RepID=A0A4Y2G1B4_ARAVE|nr:hypothetical protein AVEN_14139-1 [Araneus ventricosus]
MNKTGDGFNFLKTKFPRLSEAKIKEGIFVGPQIRQLFKDSTFMKHLNRKEKRAWLAFKNANMLAEYCWSMVDIPHYRAKNPPCHPHPDILSRFRFNALLASSTMYNTPIRCMIACVGRRGVLPDNKDGWQANLHLFSSEESSSVRPSCVWDLGIEKRDMMRNGSVEVLCFLEMNN